MLYRVLVVLGLIRLLYPEMASSGPLAEAVAGNGAGVLLLPGNADPGLISAIGWGTGWYGSMIPLRPKGQGGLQLL